MVTVDEVFLDARAGFVEVANRDLDAGESVLARQAYAAVLPAVPLSRSPVTGAVFAPRFDPVDLDGPWWDARDPARGDDRHPADVVSFAGSMALDETQIAVAPFLAVPGPAVPYVHPGVLGVDGVTAVISSVAVGPHTGRAIVYYAPPSTTVEHRLNEWGSNRYRYAGAEGQDFAYEGDWDYDLRPWIERSKLLWIEPDDDDLVLRSGADDCPYLSDGRSSAEARGIARVQGGEVWRPEDLG